MFLKSVTTLKFVITCIYVSFFHSMVLSDQDNQFLTKFRQSDYEIKFERGEIFRYNKTYVQNPRIVTFKHNRTCTAFNASLAFRVDVSTKLEAVVQGYRFASNEYRLFPMRFQYNVCNAFSENLFGFGADAASKCGNFTGCPVIKGKIYHLCSFIPDPSKFPPLIPNGRYMVEIQVLYLEEETFVIRVYLEVTRPFTGK